MKVFAYTRPPLNGRHMVGRASISNILAGRSALTPDGAAYHVALLTVIAAEIVTTELVILLHSGQSPASLPGWRPADVF